MAGNPEDLKNDHDENQKRKVISQIKSSSGDDYEGPGSPGSPGSNGGVSLGSSMLLKRRQSRISN